jgi:hypothetical protein
MKDTILMIVKVVVTLLVLPVIVAITYAFQGQLAELDPALKHSLWLGVMVYMILKFFVYGFEHVYRFGQNIVTYCFQFLKPLVNVAPYVLPVFTILTLIVFAVLNAFDRVGDFRSIFFSAIAFTFAMHIILTAQDLYNKDASPGKPNYFFGMALVYIFDVFLIALIMHFTLPGFSFIKFFQSLASTSFDIYKTIFHQLF